MTLGVRDIDPFGCPEWLGDLHLVFYFSRREDPTTTVAGCSTPRTAECLATPDRRQLSAVYTFADERSQLLFAHTFAHAPPPFASTRLNNDRRVRFSQ